jgi:rod shape determining protein RodA
VHRTRILRNLDFILLLPVLLLILIGIITIGSATHMNMPNPNRYYYVMRQSMFVIANLVLGYYFLRFDYRMLKDLTLVCFWRLCSLDTLC